MTREPLVREIICDALVEILEKGSFSHVILSQALTKYQYLEKNDRSFIKRVIDGTIENRILIDAYIDAFSKVKVKKMKPFIRNLMRMSVYQILFMERIPDSAAVNEAVKIAVKRGFSGLRGFVNGVLRTISREKDNFIIEDKIIRYSMPEWLYRHFESSYGTETADKICEAFLKDRALMARVNTSRATVEEVIQSLKEQGITAEPLFEGSYSLKLSGVDYPEQMNVLREGLIQIQDFSSSAAGDACCIKKGDIIVDVCGAPGGKAIHAAELLEGTGAVLVRDISPAKIDIVNANIMRSGLTNIEAEVYDALQFDASLEEKADVVIADLPCSGLGIIGRKPDIKYNVSPEEMKELAKLQKDILSVIYRYVKPGGILCYSTCTLNPDENINNYRYILSELPFEPVNLQGIVNIGRECDSLKEGYVELIPGIDMSDGFFIAAFKRV